LSEQQADLLADDELRDASGPAIEVRDLVNAFGDHVVHDHLNLTVERGEVMGVVGGSGAGKSVLLNSIIGLRRPQQGVVRVFGQDLAHASRRSWGAINRSWGVLFQQGALFSNLTVRDNVAAPMFEHTELTKTQAYELADLKIALVGLRPDAGMLKPAELSGGMRKRAGLARALALDPELLFLDEPTAGLDPQARHATWDLVRELRADGVTVVLTTHYMDEAEQLADDVVIIDGGRAIAQGSPEELCRGGAENTLRFSGRPGLDLASLLNALPADTLAAELTPGNYRIEGKVDPQLLATVTSWCAQHGVMPDRLAVERRTLEDVFLEMTGKELRG
jgi:ABC-2 type transport system ATP-binding protein